VVDDERGAVIRENIFEEPMEKYISVHLLQDFTVIPGRWPNKSMIRPFVSPVEEVASELILQTAQCLNTPHDICESNPFTEIVK
jgi:hypothetical protein